MCTDRVCPPIVTVIAFLELPIFVWLLEFINESFGLVASINMKQPFNISVKMV